MTGTMLRRALGITAMVASAALLALGVATATAAGPDGAWAPPATIDPEASVVSIPRAALSADGTRATAIWLGFVNGRAVARSASATIVDGVADWGLVTTLSPENVNSAEPQVALTPDGSHATVVWTQNDGTFNRVVSASATIDGATQQWGSLVALSAEGAHAQAGQVQASSDGAHAVATWTRNDGANDIVQAKAATIDGTAAVWEAEAHDLSEGGQDSYTPLVALSSSGARAVIMWSRWSGTAGNIHTRIGTITGGTSAWTEQDTVSGGDASGHHMAMSADGGRITAAWVENNGTTNVIRSRSATVSGAGASWGPGSWLSATGTMEAPLQGLSPRVALSADGSRAAASWTRWNGSGVIHAATATIAGNVAAWGDYTELSDPAQSADISAITMSAGGSFVSASWLRNDGTSDVVQSSSARLEGGIAEWGEPDSLSASGPSAQFPSMVASANGQGLLAIWRSNAEEGLSLQAATGTLPAPSNSFALGMPTVGVTARAVTFRTSLTVAGQGTVTQSITRRVGTRKVAVCTTTARPSTYGEVRLTCRAGLATRRALRNARITFTLRTTYTPTDGTANTKSVSRTVARRR